MRFLLTLVLSAVFLLSSTVSLACDRLISTKNGSHKKASSLRAKKLAKNSKSKPASKKVARHKKPNKNKKNQMARHQKVKQLPPKFVRSRPVKDDELSLDSMLATSTREPSAESDGIPLPEIAPMEHSSQEEIHLDF